MISSPRELKNVNFMEHMNFRELKNVNFMEHMNFRELKNVNFMEHMNLATEAMTLRLVIGPWKAKAVGPFRVVTMWRCMLKAEGPIPLD